METFQIQMDALVTVENLIKVSYVFYAWVIIRLFDMATGIAAAWYNGVFKSREMRQGMFRFLMEIAAIAFLKVIDYTFDLQISMSIICATFFIIKDIFSVLENFALCGVAIPKEITDRMASLKDAILGKQEEKKA